MPTQKPARSNWSSGITPGCSAVSPPSSAHPARRHPSATPATSSRDLLGHDAAHRHVVEEEQRLGARAHDVVGAHRDEVDPDRVDRRPVRRAISSLVPTPSVAAASSRPSPIEKSPANPPTTSATSGRRAGGKVGDQRDGLGGGLGVDAGAAVGVAHAQPVGSWSWSSSTNLPASSGISIGYSPSKHARQNESFVAACGLDHALEREVAERVGADVGADLLHGEVGRDQLLAGRHVDAVEARPLQRRARDRGCAPRWRRPRAAPPRPASWSCRARSSRRSRRAACPGSSRAAG